MIPPVFISDTRIDGANANHNLWRIRIWKDVECFNAVLAQERHEWWLLRQWGLIGALPCLLGLLLPVDPMWPIWAALMVWIASSAWVRLIPPLHRRMEMEGHLLEAQIAAEQYGKDFDKYLAKEARALTGYKQFKGWSADDCEAAMRRIMEGD